VSLVRSHALLLALLCSVGARAETRCASRPELPQVASFDGEERLRFLDQALKRVARRARLWTWMWAGIYSGLAVYNLAWALAPPHDRARTIDGSVGAAGSLVGLAVLAILPPSAVGGQYRFARHLRARPEVCAAVAEAERLLVKEANDEAFGKSALVHAGTFAFNALLGGLLAGVWGHGDQAAITALVGTAIGEAQIFTRPTTATQALERYRAGLLGAAPERSAAAWMVLPQLGPAGAGISLAGAF